MSWSQWHLAPLSDNASDRSVLEGGGRLWVVGCDEHGDSEPLSDRWTISWVRAPRTAGELPHPGDVVVWRAISREDPEDRWTWGSPTRLLAWGDTADPDVVEFVTLDDGLLDERADEEDLIFVERVVAREGLVAAEDVWAVLGTWRLHPLCPNCGGRSKVIVFGMVTSDLAERDDVVLGGCSVIEGLPMPTHLCSACHLEFIPRAGPLR